MGEPRRATFRLGLGQPARVRFGERHRDGWVLDLSVGGAQVRLADGPHLPYAVTLDCILADRRLVVLALVAREAPGGRYGLEFLDGDADGVARTVADLQREALAKGVRLGRPGRGPSSPPWATSSASITPAG